MNYKMIMRSALLLSGLAIGGGALAATPSAEMLANTCAGCHGTEGVSQGPASPTIAGISKSYFIETMKAYKSDERPATVMNRIAKGYTDEEIALMADYFAERKFGRTKQAFDVNLAKRGAALHNKYCERCHEDGGRSKEDDAGILAGQWTPYLEYTMADFMSGTREMPKKMKQRVDAMHKSVGDEAFKQLLNYYASQAD